VSASLVPIASAASVTMDRAARLDRLTSARFDVVVIGGGITGAGIARDAALRGLSVALLEADDWASGTSSRSSRLVHGGVRYLEHGHLHLVFESSRERRALLRLAPHLVRPLQFTWPVYRGARVPRWKLVAGLFLYDALALFRNVGNHRPLSTAGVLAAEPALRREGLAGGAQYWDAATDDARLTLATVLGAREAGAVTVNHVLVEGIAQRDRRATGVRVRDRLTGHELAIDARVVVNAAGPWSDEVRRLDEPDAAGAVRGTKGVHVLVSRSRVGNRAALTLVAPQDGRVMFALPAGSAGDFAMIGTTDTRTNEHPAGVRASSDDVAYLLGAANHFFPEARLTSADVTSAWAGIRPLASGGWSGRRGTGAGTDAAASASREHAIATSPTGVISITGGKLTTYRAMAAEVVDAVQSALGVARTGAGTLVHPLPGGAMPSLSAELSDAARATGDEAVATRLVRAFGTRWREVWALAERDGTLAERVVPGRPYLLAELRWAMREEEASTLADLLVRRTHVAFETPDAGRAAARAIAPVLGFDERAVAEYEREATRLFAISV
jgi:glycerol-3-phosphate dehydrogenase